jgi:hypothetical protein
MAEYLPITESLGNLEGICPDCDAMIHRRASKRDWLAIGGNWASSLRRQSDKYFKKQ